MHPIRFVAPAATIVLCLSALAGPSISLAQSPSAPPISADWPMFRGDASRRGESAEGLVGQPVLRWRYQAQGAVNSTISVVGDLAYAASDDGILHALDLASGTERWSFVPEHSPVSAPSVADGTVYTFDGLGTLFALDAATGTERWHAASPLDGPSSPTVEDGGLYVGTGDGDLVAIDAATGAERWRYAIPSATGVHSPAIANGVVYVASDGGGLVAVDASTGQLLWRFDTGDFGTATAVVADGIVYIGANPDTATSKLWALDAVTGAELWESADPLFAPAVSDGVAFSGSATGLVAAHDPTTGKELWRFQVKGTARGTGVAQGVVYVPADTEHRIYALDAATGHELWHFDVDGGNDGGIAIAQGSVFVGTSLGGVYDIAGDGSTAVPSTSPGPASQVPATPSGETPSAAPGSPAAVVASSAEFLWSATGGADGMNFPASLAFDPEGRVWVADTANGRFAIFMPDGTFVEYWGTKGKGDGEFNLQQPNGNPNGQVAFAPDGSFYVLDAGNRRVQHFGRDRTFLGSWGGFGTDPGQYNDLIGIAVDAQGMVHVLDDGRDVVETYDPDGKVLGSFSPHLAGPNSANSMTLDPQGNVYISACCAAGNRIIKFDPNGTVSSTIGAAGQPNAMTVDGDGRLFVTGGSTPSDNQVLVFDTDGTLLASFGSPGSGLGQLGFAWGVILDGEGNVYVADADPSRLEKFRLIPPFGPGSAGPSPAALVPEGRYATAPVTPDQIRSAITAAGYDATQWETTAKSSVFTLDFDSGRLHIYMSDDGGPVQVGWNGTYEVVDQHTLVARDDISTITYDYSLVGDVLTLRMVSDTLQDPGELAAQSGIYDTAPFTRLP